MPSAPSDQDWTSFLPVGLLDLPRDTSRDALGVRRSLHVAALFADVSGSTAVSEALAREGAAGTEEFSGLINGVLGPMVGHVHRHGGEVAKFAGDAVTAVFPTADRDEADVARRALRCAADIQAGVRDGRARATTVGRLGLSVSIGVAIGPAAGTVVGDPRVRLEHVLGGRALSLCERAQHLAGPGEIVGQRRLLQLADAAGGAEPVATEAGTRFLRPARFPAAGGPWPGDGSPAPVPGAAEATAPFLHRTVRSAVRAGQEGLLQEHRRVTSLFCAFDDPDRGPSGPAGALQDLTVAILGIVERFDGCLNRIDLGEGTGRCLVLFGAPVAHEDDEDRAVACALELRRLPGLAGARIGANTGTVFCGLLGSPARREYTVLGDGVNVAARLAQMARAGQILVGEPTRSRTAARWSWTSLGPVALRGRRDPVDVSEAVRELAVPARAESGPTLPMVGRAAPLRRAEALVNQARHGAGHVLVIAGQAGVGKSRLLEEIVRLAAERGFEVHRGAARSYGGDAGAAAWRELWSTILGLDATDLGRASAELRRSLAEAAPGLAERAPVVGSFLDLPGPADASERLEPEERTAAVHDALLAVLRARQRRAPQALALEDGQWLDPASLELLARVAAVAGGLRVLVVVTARTEAVDDGDPLSLRGCEAATHLGLRELGPRAMARFVRLKYAQLGGEGSGPPGELVEALVARAQGNPFYAEELVSVVHEQGADTALAAAGAPGDVPENVRMLIAGRVDALDERDRAVLKVASVIGRRFAPGWLWGAYPTLGTPADVRRALARLSALDLTPADRSASDDAHVFKHALAQEAVYQTLSLDTRRALHEAVARYVERSQDRRRRQVLELLAFHYGRSANADKQRRYFRRAGDAASAAYAGEAAVAQYRRLLPLLAEPERGDVLIDLGEMLQLGAAWGEAERCFRESLAIATRTGQPRCRTRAGAALGGLFARTKDYPEAVRWLERARADFAVLDDRRELVKVLERLAYTCFEQGDYDNAVRHASQQRELAGELEDLRLESTAIETLGLVSWHRHELEQGRRELERALALAETADHKVNVVHALNDLAGVLLDLGRPADAVEHLRRAHALARDIGYRRFSGMIVANVAELHRTRGEAAQALACAAHALGTFASLHDVYGVLYAAGTVAMVRHEQGALDDAERLLELVAAKAGSADNRRFRADALLEQARVRLARGRPAGAAEPARRAAEVAARIGHPEVSREARLLLIAARAASRHPTARAGGELDELDGLLAAAQDDAERASVSYVLWQLDPRRDDARRKAARVYREIAVRTGRADARRRFAELTGERLPPPEPLPAVLQDAPTQPGSPSEAVALAAAALSGLAEGGAPRPTAEAALSFSV